MAPRHSRSVRLLLVSGGALLALGLVLQPCAAQTSQPAKPVAKEAGAVGKKAVGKKDAKPSKPTSPLQIAIVDMDKATTAHPLFETRRREHSAWARKQDAELDKLRKTIQAKQAQLKNTVQPGTPAAAKLALEIETLRFKLSTWRKQLSNQDLARRDRLFLELQAQVRDAINELAPRRGIHLVLRRRAQPAQGPLRGQVRRAESTDVLYAVASLDITDDVIEFLKTKHPRK